jgi:tetratricopeptide (TPR) repeat protein
MKKILCLFIFILSIGFVNAKEKEDFKNKARELKTNSDYKNAIKFYIKAIKNTKDTNDLIELYFEVSDCYFQIDNKKMAVRVVKEAIIKFGVTKMDIISFYFIDSSTPYFFINSIKDYNKLRQKYISSLDDIDDYIGNSKFIVEM